MADFQEAELCSKGSSEEVVFMLSLGSKETQFTLWVFREKLSGGLVNQ